jgi:hypothetical protein
MRTRILLASVVLLLCVGCLTSLDPNTGQTIYRLDPNVVGSVETVVETGISVGGLLGAIFPVILPFVTLAGGIYGTWKKIKPQVTKAQTEATLYHTAVASLVEAIEDYKEFDPDGWENLKDKIKVGDKVENVIRALRGLPPKE